LNKLYIFQQSICSHDLATNQSKLSQTCRNKKKTKRKSMFNNNIINQFVQKLIQEAKKINRKTTNTHMNNNDEHEGL
jgi:hypothetical protein